MLLVDPIIPYELPDKANHSFFFIDQAVRPASEAKLHRHDAWELVVVKSGAGEFLVGNESRSFQPGTVGLVAPNLAHRWCYSLKNVDEDGLVRYAMAAFSHEFVKRLIDDFPEVRNQLDGVSFPQAAFFFGPVAASVISEALRRMSTLDEVDRLAQMIQLVAFVFSTTDREKAGEAVRMEAAVRRVEKAISIVMRDYAEPIRLSAVAREVGMNPSAFSDFFHRQQGVTFSEFLTNYRLKVAADLLLHTRKQVGEICALSGYRDLGHFSRTFRRRYGLSPLQYRKGR